jgi:N-succinyldiaminopimelate aminotransferase
MAGGEPLFVPAGAENGFLPDYASLPRATLDRVALAYFCSPANPQGAVASSGQLRQLLELAHRHDFLVASDECYSEIYDKKAPAGMLSVGQDSDFANLLVFNSLSKRSSAPGLRCGFVAGDAKRIADLAKLRSYGGASVPLPILTAASALWRDEAHVEDVRARYRENFACADRLLGQFPGYRRPDGGFFLWFEVGDGEAAAIKLWRGAGLKTLPGAYLSRSDAKGFNPGAAYIRIALVHDLAQTEQALTAMKALLADNQIEDSVSA